MKIIYSLFLIGFFSFLSSQSWALDAKKSSQLFRHLQEVNKNWSNINPATYQEQIQFATDADRIQRHLQEVEKVLRQKETHHLGIENKRNRLKMLDVLHAYSSVGNFPINTFHSARQPYFIDLFGTHCAVGYLVKESGFPEISLAIAKTQNFAYVPEIQSKELIQWSIDFGFSLEELALIQPTYMPTQSYSQIGQGANGKVTQSTSYGSKWVFGGEFDTLDNLPCLHIGKYENGQLSCLGSGLDGEINGLDNKSLDGVRAIGHFNDGGDYYPIATFANNTWSYQSIPGRPNSRATALGAPGNSFYYIAIDHPTISNEQEIWLFSYGNWEKIGKVYGVVNAIDHGNGSFGGVFDSCEMLVNNVWTSYVSKNVLTVNYPGYQSVTGIVPDTVLTLSSNQNVLFVGGTTNTQVGSSGCLVSSILNSIAQPLLTTNDLFSSAKYGVHYLTSSWNSLLIAGDFHLNPINSYYHGKNIGVLYPASGLTESLGFTDETVYTFGYVNQTFCIGGDFSNSQFGGMFGSGSNEINRLAKLDGFASLEENNNFAEKIVLSPNPSLGNIEISGIQSEEIQIIEIFNSQGKSVLKNNETTIDAHTLDAGVYLVRIVLQNGQTIQKRWVKE